MLNVFDQYNRGWQQRYGGQPQPVQNPAPSIDPNDPKTWPPGWLPPPGTGTEQSPARGQLGPVHPRNPIYDPMASYLPDYPQQGRDTIAPSRGGWPPAPNAPFERGLIQPIPQPYPRPPEPIQNVPVQPGRKYQASASAPSGSPDYADFSKHIEDIKAEAKGLQRVTNPATWESGGAPFLGAPLSGNQQQKTDEYGQPISNTSELSSADTGDIAASARGRFNLTAPSSSLTDVGGMKGEDPTAPAENLGSSIQKIRAQQGGGGGTGIAGISSIGANVGTGGSGSYTPVTFGGGGGGAAGGGGGGMFGGAGGGGGAGMASAIGGILSSFASQVAKNNAPMSVDPSKWANAPPAPVQFMPPSLRPNQGGTWYTS
jgi:hypothetical protein